VPKRSVQMALSGSEKNIGLGDRPPRGKVTFREIGRRVCISEAILRVTKDNCSSKRLIGRGGKGEDQTGVEDSLKNKTYHEI